jgi:hypothetical protein
MCGVATSPVGGKLGVGECRFTLQSPRTPFLDDFRVADVQNVAGPNDTDTYSALYGQIRGVHFRDGQLFGTNMIRQNVRLRAMCTRVAC